MPTSNIDDLVKRIDLSQLYPPFRALYVQLLKNCRDRGVDYYAISGLRSIQEQRDLYALGRTVKVKADGSPQGIVTKAVAGRSAHNYGVATDSCKDSDANKSGLQPGWNLADYEVLADEAEKLGLEAALRWVNFKEGPHAQLPLKKHKAIYMWDTLIAIYNKGGQAAVWAEFDRHTWDGKPCKCQTDPAWKSPAV